MFSKNKTSNSFVSSTNKCEWESSKKKAHQKLKCNKTIKTWTCYHRIHRIHFPKSCVHIVFELLGVKTELNMNEFYKFDFFLFLLVCNQIRWTLNAEHWTLLHIWIENEYWYIDTDEKYVETLSVKLVVIPTGDLLFNIEKTEWIMSTYLPK